MPDDAAADATATLVHFSNTGAVELEVEEHKTTTMVKGSVAHISALRPGSHTGHLAMCTPVARLPGWEQLMALLSNIRGSLASFVRHVGRPVSGDKVDVDCAGDLWHIRSHGEDALVCLEDDKILEVNTERMSIAVMSHSEGDHGSPLAAPECDSEDAAPEASEAAYDKGSMWARQTTHPTWFALEGGQDGQDVTAPTDPLQPDEPTPETPDVPVVIAAASKDCVFIHGVGQTPALGSAPILTGSFADYWGKIEEHTPQCRSRIFLNVDSLQRGWDDVSLQTEVCAAATYDPVTDRKSVV